MVAQLRLKEALMDTQNARAHRGLDELENEIISGRYQIIRRIGKGGMGVVYLATQTNLVREVCIKVLNPALLDDEDAVGRFEREAKGLSRLQHPNIVSIFDYGRDGDLAYIVMEYAKGETLSKYLKKHGAMTLDEFVPVAAQTLKGIGEAHKIGLIHRDIKPANIMLCELEGEQNFVKILDFGLAKLAQGQEDLTKDQQLVGSASYMAPEQILSGVSDTRTDVYALGVMFYFMLSGKKPFTGANDNAILYQHVNATPAPLKSVVDPSREIPDTLCQVIDQALSKDADKRPQTANEMLNAISIALDAPQIRAGYSSMSLSRVDLKDALELKEAEDSQTQTYSQPSQPSGSSGSGSQSAQSIQNAAVPNSGESISAVIVTGANGVSTVLPVANLSDTTTTFDQSRAARASKDRKMLIVVLCCVGLIVAIVVSALVRYATNHKTHSSASIEQIKPEKKSLDQFYERIEKSLAQGQWQDAENLIQQMAVLEEAKTPEHLLKVDDYHKQIEVLKQFSKARKATQEERFEEAMAIYQNILERNPSHEVAQNELEKLKATMKSFASVELKIANAEDAEFFIDGESKGGVPESVKLSLGRHTFKVTKSGYQPWTKEIELKDDTPISLNILLTPIKNESEKPATKPDSSKSNSNTSDSMLLGGSKKDKKNASKSFKSKTGLLL